MASIKGPAPTSNKLDGSPLRIAIVHSRWNKTVIDALLAGTIAKLKEHGVKDSHIVVQSVPGSFELPLACSKCVCLLCLLSLIRIICAGSSQGLASRRARAQLICLGGCISEHL